MLAEFAHVAEFARIWPAGPRSCDRSYIRLIFSLHRVPRNANHGRMLTSQGCLSRRKRLQTALKLRRCDGCILSWHKHVYYFGGTLPDPAFPSAFLMDADGHAMMVLHSKPADPFVPVEAYDWISFVRASRPREAEFLAVVSKMLKCPSFRGVRRVGVDGACVSHEIVAAMGKISPKIEIVDLTPDLLKMRRTKDADEVATIQNGIRITEIGYERAKEVIAVGKTELDVYHAMSEAMDRAAGKHIELKGDFGCGIRGWKEGGLPTSRRIQKGDLYILDIFPEVNGYYGDITRVFAAGPISSAQRKAWDCILETIEATEKIIEPGLPGKTLFNFVNKRLARFKATKATFFHHAGHGLGLNHEHPRFTPKSDEHIVEGSVFTLEPGLYGYGLQGGLRIEHNYWLKADGLHRLDSYPTGHD